MALFPEYIAIRYLATFQDRASSQAIATDRAIRRATEGSSSAAVRGFGQATQAVNRFGATTKNVGRGMSTYLTLPIVAAGGAATKMALEYDQAITRVQALTGQNQKQIAGWSNQIQRLSVETGTNAKDLADSLYFIASAGLKANQIMPTLAATARAAAAGLGDAENIADTLTSALNAYANSGLTAAQATDVLTNTIKYGKAEPNELAESLGRVLGPAALMKVRFDEVGASIAAMSNLGLDASEGVTALRQILLHMLHPAAHSEKELERLGTSAKGLRLEIRERGLLATLQDLRLKMGAVGVDTGKLREIAAGPGGLNAAVEYLNRNAKTLNNSTAEIFPNVRALAGFLLLTGENASGTSRIFEQMSKNTNATNKAFETASQSGMFQLRQAMAQLQVTAIEMGHIIAPIFVDIVQKVTGVIQGFRDMPASSQRLIITGAAIVAGLGPVLFIFGSMLTSITAIVSAMFTIPGALAVFAGFAAAGILMKRGINDPMEALQTLVTSMEKAWPRWRDRTVAAISAVVEILGDMGDVLLNIGQAVDAVFQGDWDAVWDHMGLSVTSFKNLFVDVMNTATSSFKGFMATVAVGGLIGQTMLGGGRLNTAARGSLIGRAATGAIGWLGGGIGAGRATYRAERQIMAAGIPAARNAAGRLVYAAGTGMGGQFVAGGTAAMATQTSRIGAAALAARAGVVALSTSLGPVGMVLAAGVAAAAVYGLWRAFNDGEGATQRLHRNLQQTRTDLMDLNRDFRQAQSNAIEATGLRLQDRGDVQAIKRLREELSHLKRGSDEYASVSLEIQQIENNRKNTALQLKEVNQQNLTLLQKMNDEARRSDVNLFGGATRSQIAAIQAQLNGSFLGPRIRNVLPQIAAHGDQFSSIGDVGQAAGLNVNERRILASSGITIDDLKTLAEYQNRQQQIVNNLPRWRKEYQDLVAAGMDPANKKMQALATTINHIVGMQRGLSLGPEFTKAIGGIISNQQADRLKDIGGVTSGVRELVTLLGRIPSDKEFRFAAAIPADARQGLKEFIRDTKTLPSARIVRVFLDNKQAQTGIAALLGQLKGPLSPDRLRRVIRLGLRIPPDAQDAMSKWIRGLDHFPTQQELDKRVARWRRYVARLEREIDKTEARSQIGRRKGGVNVDGEEVQAQLDRLRRRLGRARGDRSELPGFKIRMQFDTSDLKERFKTVGGEIKSGLKIPLKNVGQELTDTLTSGIDRTIPDVKSWLKVSGDGSLKFSNQIGFPMVEGIAQGAGKEGPIRDALNGAISKAMSAVRKKWDIKSPSRVWASQVGRPIADGIAAGVRSGHSVIQGAVNEVVSKAVKKAKAETRAQMGSGGVGGVIGGPHGTAATGANQAWAKSHLAAYGWGQDQWGALQALWNRESGWNQFAENASSGAYGIPQALPASKMASAGADWRTNPITQMQWGLSYIKGRYGSPGAAWAHSQATGWYEQGGMVREPLAYAHRGEYVLPAAFVQAVLARSSRNAPPPPPLPGTNPPPVHRGAPPPPPFPGSRSGGGDRAHESWMDTNKQFMAFLRHATIRESERQIKRMQAIIHRMRLGGVDKDEKKDIDKLTNRIKRLRGHIIDLLEKQFNDLEQQVTRQNSLLTRMQLRQQLRGVDETPAAARAQANFIQHHIIPRLRREREVLEREARAEGRAGHNQRARELRQQALDKQNEILQAQLDKQNLIEENTRAAADRLRNMNGALSFEFGGQSNTDLAASLTGT